MNKPYRYGLTGLVLGAVAGAILIYFKLPPDYDPTYTASQIPGGGLGGALLGAIIGFLIGRH